MRRTAEEVARTARHCEWRVRAFSAAILATVPHSIAVSKLGRPFLYDRCFSVAVRRPRRDSSRSPEAAHQQTPGLGSVSSSGSKQPRSARSGNSTKRSSAFTLTR